MCFMNFSLSGSYVVNQRETDSYDTFDLIELQGYSIAHL